VLFPARSGKLIAPMTLPLFITRSNKYLAGAIMYSVSYLCYYLTNHHPLFEPELLPMTWIDRNTPFVPGSVLIYISEYFYFAFVYILLRQSDNINKYLYSFFSLQLISCAIFVVYPTTYPRDLYPVPADTPQWLASIWTWLRAQDAATNCLPSLHVSSVYLSSFAFLSENRRRAFGIFFCWSTLIALSTLTTKQHYLADIVSGLTLAVPVFYWFHYLQPYRNLYGERSAPLAVES
jgi:membrane-associated phospholipid phosphatase